MAIMATSSRPRNLLWGVLLLAIFVGLRYFRENQAPTTPKSNSPSEHVDSSTTRENGWTIHRSCTLVNHPHNDGDSFRVRLPDGTERDYRLYFVDTPESQFKRYRDGNTNAARIGEQARYFNAINSEDAVAIGQKAKTFTLDLLRDTRFDVITKNEAVYGSERHYAHIEVNQKSLDEMLVEHGLARIHTKGADLADGTSLENHRVLLRSLEATAKKQKRGAWK